MSSVAHIRRKKGAQIVGREKLSVGSENTYL